MNSIKEFLSDVARASSTPVQVEETLEFLINRFRRNLETHGINSTTTGLFSYVVTNPEFLEMLAEVGPDWGTGALFSMEHRKIGLLDCETTPAASFVAFLPQMNWDSVNERFEKGPA